MVTQLQSIGEPARTDYMPYGNPKEAIRQSCCDAAEKHWQFT